jgi:hypothetical protein
LRYPVLCPLFRRLKPTGHVHGGFREGVIDGDDLGAGISWMFETEGETSRSAEGKCGMRTVALFEEDVVLGVGEASKGGKKSGDGVQCVVDDIADG